MVGFTEFTEFTVQDGLGLKVTVDARIGADRESGFEQPKAFHLRPKLIF